MAGSLIVAIDGPSGTGKSTVSRAVAKQLHAAYLDTGAMYRVATLWVLRQGIDSNDAAAVATATAELPVGVSSDPDNKEVLLDGEDVSREIRGADVTAHVSAVAAVPAVRQNLVDIQRKLVEQAGRIVVEGRDIGTVVLVDAPTKIFMTASAQIRAQRRFDQDQAAGRDVNYDHILADVQRRDLADSSRKTSPLRPADDATVVDTSQLTIDEVIERIIGLVEQTQPEGAAHD